MNRKTVAYLLKKHGINKLLRVHTSEGFRYSSQTHQIRVFQTLDVFEIRTLPLASSDVEYVSFDNVSKLLFDKTVDANSVEDVDGEIEGLQTNERRRIIFVQPSDVGADYIDASIGHVKYTRTYAVDAAVGDPCTVVQFFYRVPNQQLLPNLTERRADVVTPDDLV
jgi:hypothetical protein